MAASVNDPRNDHICLGCGVVINNASDRRNLCGNASQNVSSAWKGLLKAELEGRGCGSTFESLFSADGELLTNYGNQRNMCRKCFYSYERMLKTQEVCTIMLEYLFLFYYLICQIRQGVTKRHSLYKGASLKYIHTYTQKKGVQKQNNDTHSKTITE